MRKLIIAILFAMAAPFVVNAADGENVAPEKRQRVVVLDPGHGGSRPGKAVGKIYEKTLNLDVALEVKSQLAKKMPDLVVYLTRSCDSMYDANRDVDNRMRAEFANRKGADLTVGIHANAHENTAARGSEVWILSLNDKVLNYNKQKANRFADEGDYIDVENIDRSSMGFMLALARQLDNEPRNRNFARVLCNNFKSIGLHDRGVHDNVVWTLLYYLEGPGALVETGYMSNPEELKYLASDKGKKEVAGAISDAIVYFVKGLDAAGEYAAAGVESGVAEQPKAEAQQNKGAADASGRGYTIQLISSQTKVDVNDSQFKSYRGRVMLVEGSGSWKYKYCYGSYATAEEAKRDLAEVRKSFKDAYVVRYEAGKLAK
ncbi:MAG: N-acetylmuramoyl-L-alanine amidase [Alistipes sp.]|nr:N-acetylmuramoyl-L-alanine amidase [Alistipes sp.]